jgi:hypothetical protein
MLKHTLKVSLVSVVCLLSGLTSPKAAWAEAPDYICYIQIDSTQIVDLTRSVCMFDSKELAKAAANNAVYLGSVKKLVESNDSFVELIDSNPKLIIAAAQNYCAARRSGMSEQQYMESQHEELMSTLSETATIDGNSEQMKQYETTFMATAVPPNLRQTTTAPVLLAVNLPLGYED